MVDLARLFVLIAAACFVVAILVSVAGVVLGPALAWVAGGLLSYMIAQLI